MAIKHGIFTFPESTFVVDPLCSVIAVDCAGKIYKLKQLDDKKQVIVYKVKDYPPGVVETFRLANNIEFKKK